MKMSQKYRSTPGGCSENSKELETRNRHIHEFLLFCLIFLASGPKNHKKNQVRSNSKVLKTDKVRHHGLLQERKSLFISISNLFPDQPHTLTDFPSILCMMMFPYIRPLPVFLRF